jgi:hypothetical protein
VEPCGEVDGDGEHQVHQPQAGEQVNQAEQSLEGSGTQSHEQVAEVYRCQADEQQPDRPVSGVEEDGNAECGHGGEGDRHAGVGTWIIAAVTVPAKREPVDAVGGEGQCGHVEDLVAGEDLEPGQSDEQHQAGQ